MTLSYEKKGIIRANDYNELVAGVNEIYGVGIGNKGYGGNAIGPISVNPTSTPISSLPTINNGAIISNKDWLGLHDAYVNCTKHQGAQLVVQQKAANAFPSINISDDIFINGTQVIFTTGSVSITGTISAVYKTSDGIDINGTAVTFKTGNISITGDIPITPSAVYTTDDGISINGTHINFTIGEVTETGTTTNPTTFGETITINGTDVILSIPSSVVSTGFNEFLGTIGEGEIASFTGVTVVDDGGAPITPAYSLFSGTLPIGLSINSSTGEISGTVTNGSIITDTIYNFAIDATDGTSIQQNFTIHANVATFEAGTGTTATGRTQIDTTTFINDLNLIYGLGSGTIGYGQIPFVAPALNQEVTTTDLFSWKSSISKMEAHQGITLSPILPVDSLIQDPKPWDANTFYNTLITNLNQVELNPLLSDATSVVTTVDPNGVSQTLVSAWNVSAYHEFAVVFTDHDHARAFFNAGGQIILAASRSGGTVSAQNTDWTNLLSTTGDVIFDATDYFALTTSFATKANFTGSGAYITNNWDISVKSNTTTDASGRGGKGFIITFISKFNDDYTGGADNIDGTLTSDISMSNVNGIYLTIPPPVFTTISALSDTFIATAFSGTTTSTVINGGSMIGAIGSLFENDGGAVQDIIISTGIVGTSNTASYKSEVYINVVNANKTLTQIGTYNIGFGDGGIQGAGLSQLTGRIAINAGRDNGGPSFGKNRGVELGNTAFTAVTPIIDDGNQHYTGPQRLGPTTGASISGSNFEAHRVMEYTGGVAYVKNSTRSGGPGDWYTSGVTRIADGGGVIGERGSDPYSYIGVNSGDGVNNYWTSSAFQIALQVFNWNGVQNGTITKNQYLAFITVPVRVAPTINIMPDLLATSWGNLVISHDVDTPTSSQLHKITWSGLTPTAAITNVAWNTPSIPTHEIYWEALDGYGKRAGDYSGNEVSTNTWRTIRSYQNGADISVDTIEITINSDLTHTVTLLKEKILTISTNTDRFFSGLVFSKNNTDLGIYHGSTKTFYYVEGAF